MTRASALLGAIAAQRAFELVLARRNTAALFARGAYETDPEQYPVMVALHATWLATLWAFGRTRAVRARYVVPFVALQAARVWTLATLRERWTTRIVILPGVAPVMTGPYRFLRHPNYAIVACELPCVSLALGLRAHAAIFGAANLVMLAWRVRAEDRAYARSDPEPPRS